MAKVVGGMAISLDGFIQDQDGDVSRLYPNFEEYRESPLLQESMEQTRAVVMGRRTYDMANGDYTGYEYQVPIFVVTHNPPPTAAKGQNDKLSITFVTDGVESAIQKAKAAAGDKEVTIVGGANVIQQAIRAGLLDELQLTLIPVFLGDGLRLFDDQALASCPLEKVRVVESVGGRTELIFRVVK